MEQNVQAVVETVCGADAQLGSEWYELLGRSAPSADDPEWTELVDRIEEVATQHGAHTDGLMAVLVAEGDPVQVQTAIAAVVWPETAAQDPATALPAEQAGYEQPVAATAEPEQEDEAAWNTYLQTNGPFWDGTEAGWPAFVEWFLYHAREQKVGMLATAFCDYAAANGALAVFAQYGVTLQAHETAAAEPVPVQAEAQSAAPQPEADAAETEGDGLSVEEAVATYGDELIAEFRTQNPEFADMTDEQLRDILAELLAGQAATA